LGYSLKSRSVISMPAFEPKHGPAYEALARRLRQAREECGLSQVEVARILGRPQSFISKLEAGERRLDIIELKLIARVYGQDLAYFDSVL